MFKCSTSTVEERVLSAQKFKERTRVL